MFRRAEMVLWAALTVLQLAPVWAFRYFPTQDGPSHLENANILLLLQRSDLPVFREYFAINRKPTPNWFGHLALAGLILVSNPIIAEKLLLTGYILGLPLAVRYAFGAFRAESAPLAVLSFPFLYNCLLHYGFYNFCLSIGLFFVAIGYWLRRRDRVGWRDTAGLGMILALLYGCHVVSWGLALLALAIFAPRAIGWLGVAAAPSVTLAAWFFVGRPGAMAAGPAVPFTARWNGLWHFSTAVSSYASADQWIGAAFALFLACAAGAGIARRLPLAAGVFSAALLALYFIAPPRTFGGGFLIERMNLYFFFSLLLWIGAVPWSPAWKWFLQTGAVAFSAILLALNGPWYLEANRVMDEYLSGVALIPANRTFLPLVYDLRGPGPMRELYGSPLRHAAGYAAVMRNAVNLDNYEAETDLFPVMFRADRNPAVFAGAIEENPPRVRLDSPLIDYLLVWDPKRMAAIAAPSFAPLYTSPQGSMRLLRRTSP